MKKIFTLLFLLFASNIYAGCFTSTAITNISCNGNCDGAVAITAVTGTPPYTLNFDGAVSSFTVPVLISNLCAGSYSYTVTDSLGSCSDTGTVIIPDPPVLTAMTTMVNTCAQSATGMAGVTVSGGTFPYSFSWSNGATTPTITGLPEGMYTVVITDANGCTVMVSDFVYTVPALVISFNNTYPTCDTCMDGSIIAVVSGGSSPYAYTWQPSGSTSVFATNLIEGVYTVCIQDAMGCFACASDTLVDPSLLRIHGRVFFDANQNGVRDTSETMMNNQTVVLSPTGQTAITVNGLYVFYTNPGTFTDSLILPANWSCTTPQSYTFSLASDTAWIDFGVYFPPGVSGYDNLTLTYGVPRCFQTVNYQMHLQSLSLPSHGYVRFTADPTMIFAGAAPSPDSVVVNDYYWSYTNWSSSSIIQTNFIMPSAGTILNIGTTLVAMDNLGNVIQVDSSQLIQFVRCSYDPNDKSVSPPGVTSQNYTSMDVPLDYRIRFQNTGNDTAFTVIVSDTIDVNLDLSSLQITGSSHPVNVTVEGREVSFHFENILLPDSIIDEPGSHGYVDYRILPTNNLPDPTEIYNTAYIYFDLNAPVVTNTVFNTLSEQWVAIADVIPLDGITVYPNPFSVSADITFNKMNESGYALSVLNSTGQKVIEVGIIKSANYRLNRKEIAAGIYFLQITDLDTKQIVTKKLMIN
jgi:uncharacterized repeat protein (TIGR01451 family)